MSRSVHKITVAAFILATAIILYFTAMWYRSTRNLIQTTRLVAQTHEVLKNLESLRAAVEEATNEVRSYLTTGDANNAAAFVTAAGRVKGNLQQIRNQTADNPRQQQRIATLERAIEERLARAQEDIERRRTQGTMPEPDRRFGVGSGRSQAIRDQIAVMEKGEAELLPSRRQAAEAASRRQIVLDIAVPIIALAFLAVFFFRIQQDFSARQEAEKALQESEERHQLLFDSSPIPMWVADRETLQFLAVNNAAVRQ